MRYINLRNPAVQILLKLIPDAISNPLKHRLLEAYLRLEDFKLREAREIVVDLLSRDDLATQATGRDGTANQETCGRPDTKVTRRG